MKNIQYLLNLVNKYVGRTIKINQKPFTDIYNITTLSNYFRNLSSHGYSILLDKYEYKILSEVKDTRCFTKPKDKNLAKKDYAEFIMLYITDRFQTKCFDAFPLVRDHIPDRKFVIKCLNNACDHGFIESYKDLGWAFIPIRRIISCDFLLYSPKELRHHYTIVKKEDDKTTITSNYMNFINDNIRKKFHIVTFLGKQKYSPTIEKYLHNACLNGILRKVDVLNYEVLKKMTP